jgi:cytochrome c2
LPAGGARQVGKLVDDRHQGGHQHLLKSWNKGNISLITRQKMGFPVQRFFTILVLILGSAAAVSSAHAADAAAGQRVSERCAICHKFGKGEGNGLGPNLFRIVGRKAASLPDFSYSGPLKASHIIWTTGNLSKWVAGPAKMVPGTMMAFPGITSKNDVADLIAYLSTLK